MEIKKVLVTPQKAEEWLKHNDSNRTLSATTWKHYLKIMRRGEWGECPQPIVRNGRALLDGQHRLRAVVEYGKPLHFWVATAATGPVRAIVDRGRVRTVADILRMEYGLTNASVCASNAKWVRFLDTGLTEKLSPPEVIEVVRKRKATFEWLRGVHGKGGKYYRGAYFCGPLSWAHKKYPKEVEAFHLKVCTGEDLKRNDPEMRLRDRIVEADAAGSSNGKMLVLTTLTAFDARLRGVDLRVLKAGAGGYQRLRRDFKLSNKGGKWAELTLKASRVKGPGRRRG